ncbi:protein CURVATURE THYLAKOID 1B, chloroplastic-like [Alnus glutinosa]|uniref:protein CURVATURE THYLAKOID 1B, chloroplastic-like n=1 Tax=Alnus glutinosa TaxID=3517 RepID=UPI002D78A9A9|nr:protein CURVATURE THYLAKOID 1B, chloroplastic-like [Alnus glutinosa]
MQCDIVVSGKWESFLRGQANNCHTSSSTVTISSSSTIVDGKAPRLWAAVFPTMCDPSIPTLPPPPMQSQNRPWKSTAYCRKIARNVMAMATGEAPAEVGANELPETGKTVQEAWDKVEDKYAVSSLAVALG